MIGIVNYGCGNTNAFVNSFKRLNIPSIVTSQIDEIIKLKKIILPGVGAFDYVIRKFNQSGLREAIQDRVFIDKIDVLGVCAGMQIFANKSEEGKEKGLGWIDGEVKLFDSKKINQTTKLPHMGWNTVEIVENPLFKGIPQKALFYFVHSYFYENYDQVNMIGHSEYGIQFTSAINKNNIYGVQFHPEKSHENGQKLLKNFANL
tara:strand:- start:84 stop:695 length:612 start_codon:yes stop_codon:yes gene_type:complete